LSDILQFTITKPVFEISNELNNIEYLTRNKFNRRIYLHLYLMIYIYDEIRKSVYLKCREGIPFHNAETRKAR